MVWLFLATRSPLSRPLAAQGWSWAVGGGGRVVCVGCSAPGWLAPIARSGVLRSVLSRCWGLMGR